MRLLVVHRRFPDVPRAYLRVVIVNMLRSIRRHVAQRFTAGSPLAQPITEELGALVKDPIDTVCDVSIWTSRLPRRLRDVYRHIYEEGRSQRDAAKIMRITQPRVAQLHRQLLEKASRDLANMAA
jgi:DNA-directed RNA polymerase specialized sigma24 family protein